jgi:ubiquitin-conjugating enzyme E2 J2
MPVIAPKPGSTPPQPSSIPAPTTPAHIAPPPLNLNAVGINGGVPGTVGAARGVGGPMAWATGWKQVIYEKWRWCALIALAVIVSRFSTTN